MKLKRIFALFCIGSIVLTGCSSNTTNETSDSTITDSEESSTGDDTASTELSLQNVTVITEVFGDGQKASAVALEYSTEIDSSSISVDDFSVEGQTIEKVYTNAEAAKADDSINGNYIILELAYENSSSPDASSGGGPGMGGGAPGMGGGGPESDAEGTDATPPDAEGTDAAAPDAGDTDALAPQADAAGESTGAAMQFNQEETIKEPITVSVTQIGDIAASDGSVCGASDTVVESTEIINLVVEDFEQYEYTDPETGNTIPYNLYLPEDYDESKTYPLIMFVADSSANSDTVTDALTQGNGGTIWATAYEQAKHECIVLVPQYTNTLISSIGALTEDTNEWSEGLTLVSNLLFDIIDEYSVDENRIYGTGQSQGCMTTIAISDKYPDLFAAQYLVAGQWNTEEMSVMKDDNLWITVSEGDTKAYPGMNEATANWTSLGTSVATSEMWDSTVSDEEFDELVASMLEQNCTINYTVFESGNHMYTWTVAYNIEGIRDWLFAQSK